MGRQTRVYSFEHFILRPPGPDTHVITDTYEDIWVQVPDFESVVPSESANPILEPVIKPNPEPVTKPSRKKVTEKNPESSTKRGRGRPRKTGVAYMKTRERYLCEHNKTKQGCKICTRERFCEHRRLYSNCKNCRDIRCEEHGKWFYNCRACLKEKKTLPFRPWDPDFSFSQTGGSGVAIGFEPRS